MGEWQPIETAPMDGTVVDIFAHGARQTNVRYLANEKTPGWYFVYDGALAGFKEGASHWMPLPPPPEDT